MDVRKRWPVLLSLSLSLLLRSALLCLRGSRSNRRRRANNVKDLDVDVELARCSMTFLVVIFMSGFMKMRLKD